MVSNRILIFHSVVSDDDSDVKGISSVRFDKMVGGLNRLLQHRKLEDLLPYRKENCRKFSLTFDDGYANNYEIAMPILQRHGVNATFFIASGYLDGGWMWNDGIIKAILQTKATCLDLTHLNLEKHPLKTPTDKQRCITNLLCRIKYLQPEVRMDLAKRILDCTDVPEPTHLMMTSKQVRLIHRAGMEIGGHTVNHPILTSVDKATARKEICENKEFLEDLIGEPLTSFAYPNGNPIKDYAPEHVKMVKEAGYRCAVSTAWGRINSNSDPFQLPRFTPWDRNLWKFMLRLWLQPGDKVDRV